MSDSPSHQRSKRQKIDKTGRFAALERLRDLKGSGSKHKYDLSDQVDNVYDTVDEKEYAKRVLHRADDNWIEDDGTGYVEDGREIFDDEDEYETETNSQNNKNKTAKNNSRKRLRDINNPTEKKTSIKSLFNNVIPKKNDSSSVKLDEDNILADILGEINTEKNEREIKLKEETLVKNYVNSFTKNMKVDASQLTESKKQKSEEDDKLIRELIKPLKPSDDTDKTSKSCEVTETSKSNDTTESIETTELTDTTKSIVTSEPIQFSKVTEKIESIVIEDTDASIFDEDFVETSQQNDKNDKLLDNIDLDTLLADWDHVNGNEFAEDPSTEPNNDCSIKTNSAIKFWLWEAWENAIRRPGELFLFGKIHTDTNEYKTACIHIENIEHCLYLLPAEYMIDPNSNQATDKKVTFMDVYNEFSDVIAKSLNLEAFRSKKVTKKFAFNVTNVSVPEASEYLEIRYDGRKGLPNPKKSYRSIAHIFGINKTRLEAFLLDCKIKGPRWLSITNFTIRSRPLSWCKYEFVCSDINSISIAEEKVQPPPPIVIASLNVRTAVNSKTNTNEIVMVAICVNDRFRTDKPPDKVPFQRHVCGFSRPINSNWPTTLTARLNQYSKTTKIMKLDSERALLSWFLTTLKTIDPDLILTHDANDCQLDALIHRIIALNIPMWSRIGRLQLTKLFDGRNFLEFFIGRMICDIKQSAEELVKLRSYDLNSLCVDILKITDNQRMDVSNEALYTMYESGDGIIKLITLTLQDCFFTLKMMCELNVLPLALQISNICGNLMNVTLQAGRNKRNEFLLLHAFTEKNYIVPDRREKMSHSAMNDTLKSIGESNKKKTKYTGGLVLDPVKGFYEQYILLMDFNSLYPSIIQEYNICFSTIKKPVNEDEEPILPDSNEEAGVLPCQIRRLVESRREVKKLMNNPDLSNELKVQYHIRQMALKLTANSMYGCLGFPNSRFFAQHLAALVTKKGREILINTKIIVQNMNFEVIYGDTDSIMINTHSIDYDHVYKIGYMIKQTVNKVYRQIELDIDGVFKNLLLLKKKKYAAVKVTKSKNNKLVLTQEQKGLDMVRRDWAPIAKMAAQKVLNELFSDEPMDDRMSKIYTHLAKVHTDIVENLVPLPLFAITKQINKNLSLYQNAASMPHIQVAKRMNLKHNRRYKAGDMIEYIICNDGTDDSATQRGYHIDELRNNSKLQVDTMYYLNNQLHPVVWRLCEVLECTNAEIIANHLGLDGKKFKTTGKKEQQQYNVGESLIKSNIKKYSKYDKFLFKCIECGAENLVVSGLKISTGKMIPVLETCCNAECSAQPFQYVSSIKNQLNLIVKKYIKNFYQNWMVCTEPQCGNALRSNSLFKVMGDKMKCSACDYGQLKCQYSEGDFFRQISYFHYMFDLTKYEQYQVRMSPDCMAAYGILNETMSEWVKLSQYPLINLKNLFLHNK